MNALSAVALASCACVVVATATEGVIGTIQDLPVNDTTSNGTRFGTSALPSHYCLVGQNIDFNGQDYVSFPGDPDFCCRRCKLYDVCVGYTWTNYQGGTCWLKNDITSAKLSMGAKGCLIDAKIQRTAKFANCDMPGNDQSHMRQPESAFSNCERWCWGTPGCAAVTWTNYEGGTCWFKTAVTNCATYPGAKTTVVFNEILY